MDPKILIGLLIGAVLPFVFASLSMKAVGRAAAKMVNEVRRQFKNSPGILLGEVRPDYGACVAISTRAAQREMVAPSILAIIAPTFVGIIFGPFTVIALLAGRAAVEIVGNNLGWNDDEETRVHKTLEKAAEFLNKDLPKQLDKNTTLVNVRVSPTENKIIFQFVIANNEAFDENRQRQ